MIKLYLSPILVFVIIWIVVWSFLRQCPIGFILLVLPLCLYCSGGLALAIYFELKSKTISEDVNSFEIHSNYDWFHEGF